MRITGGRLGGRTLRSPPARSREVRPTSDRARETLFAILGDVSDLSVLDLYCGTGALAIEAISRGADSAVLVDRKTALAKRNVTEARDRQPLRADPLRRARLPGKDAGALRPDPLRSAVYTRRPS